MLLARQPPDPLTVSAAAPARIEYLHVENYRALRAVELEEVTPLTVLLGPKDHSTAEA